MKPACQARQAATCVNRDTYNPSCRGHLRTASNGRRTVLGELHALCENLHRCKRFPTDAVTSTALAYQLPQSPKSPLFAPNLLPRIRGSFFSGLNLRPWLQAPEVQPGSSARKFSPEVQIGEVQALEVQSPNIQAWEAQASGKRSRIRFSMPGPSSPSSRSSNACSPCSM